MPKTQQDPSKMYGRETYSLRYLRGGRLFSYAHQIDSVLAFNAHAVLEVGVGTGFVAGALRAVGINVVTVDCQPELNPNITASVTSLPLEDGSVDVAVCCQVLEHLPFDLFETALRELARVATRGIVLSLPDARPYYEVRLSLPKLPRFGWVGTRSRRVPQSYRDQHWERSGHYWEIGYPETPFRRVLQAITDNRLDVIRTWRVPENPYHCFFTLDPARARKPAIREEKAP